MNISATQQTVILLSLATSSLLLVRVVEGVPSTENTEADIKTITNMGILRMYDIIKEYPADSRDNHEDTKRIIFGLRDVVDKPMEKLSPQTALALSIKVCEDLLGEVSHPAKRLLIEDSLEVLGTIKSFFTEENKLPENDSEVEEILAKVYSYLGFSKENRYFKQLKKQQRRLKQYGRASC